MTQQQQTSRSWKIVTYRIAKSAWIITVWIWTSIIIAFLAQFVPNILTANPTDLSTTLAGKAFTWLTASEGDQVQTTLRVIILIVAFLLVVIPLVAFVLKQTLQNVQREGFDKLIDILQQDTIVPQLELLQQQLKQQLQILDDCVKALGQIYSFLRQTPPPPDLQGLQTLLQQQHDLQTESSHILRDIQTRATEQVEWLDDLHDQDKRTQETIFVGLKNISIALEKMQGSLNVLSLASNRESTSSSKPETTTEHMPVVTSAAQNHG